MTAAPTPPPASPTPPPRSSSSQRASTSGRASSAQRAAGPQRTTIERRLVAAATERLPIKAAALFFALLLWFIVTAEEPTEERVEVRLNVVTDSFLALHGPPPPLTAVVIGRGRELLKLYGAPPTVRLGYNSATSPESVTVRLSPADVDIPIGIEARVQEVQPRLIFLRFDARATRMVPVRSAITVAPVDGVRMLEPPRFDPESVRVTGSRELVRVMDSVSTMRVDVAAVDTVAQTVPLDTAGLRVRVTPTRVRVRLKLQRDSVPVAAPARAP
ncbi:MAG: YbbR-like domain-containing protein [Gemmatimonadaceae bacterium]